MPAGPGDALPDQRLLLADTVKQGTVAFVCRAGSVEGAGAGGARESCARSRGAIRRPHNMYMIRNERGLILLHGAAVLVVGLLLGLAAVVEELAGSQPQMWRAAHAALLLAGVWLLAMAAVLPVLTLSPRQKAALCGSLLATAYAFTTAILVQAMSGVRALAPGGSLASWVAFVANITTVGAGLFAALLTLLGAFATLRSTD